MWSTHPASAGTARREPPTPELPAEHAIRAHSVGVEERLGAQMGAVRATLLVEQYCSRNERESPKVDEHPGELRLELHRLKEHQTGAENPCAREHDPR